MKTTARIAAAMMALLAACATPPEAREPVNAARLDGAWTVEFTLESPLLPGRMPRQQTLSGRLALLRDGSLVNAGGLSGRPTHSGSYATRFSPFGFDIDGGEVPGLEARITPRDSVEIALQPGAPVGVWMRGVLAGDSVAGTWRYDHERGGAASGRFVMRRR